MELFKELRDYGKYLKDNPFHQNLGMVNAKEYGDLEKKNISSAGRKTGTLSDGMPACCAHLPFHGGGHAGATSGQPRN